MYEPLQMIHFWGELALAKLLILKRDLLQHLHALLAIWILLLHLDDGVAEPYLILQYNNRSCSAQWPSHNNKTLKNFWNSLFSGSSYLLHRHRHDDSASCRIIVKVRQIDESTWVNKKKIKVGDHAHKAILKWTQRSLIKGYNSLIWTMAEAVSRWWLGEFGVGRTKMSPFLKPGGELFCPFPKKAVEEESGHGNSFKLLFILLPLMTSTRSKIW